MEEIWKDIPNYEKYYKISNYGVIVSIPRNGTIMQEKVLKQYKDKYGYLKVILQKNGIKKNKYIHQLVAQTFLDNPNICGDMQKNSISLLHFYTNTF